MRSLLSLLLLIASCVAAPTWPPHHGPNAPYGAAGAWSVKQFSSLVTFGDSYTDENRLGYFINNNGSAPPPGTLLPEVFS